jgi:hypothetical protein
VLGETAHKKGFYREFWLDMEDKTL